jgi:NAD(P)-dependent dehydrogenase (short-subunit alcohol dehydrogenase family)
VFAPIEVARAALPLMLPQQRGCIVNIGSVSGVMTTPFAGAYCASKAALHALSDALRMELAPLGIKVVVVQPGAIKSRLGETGNATVVLPQDSLYAPIADAVRRRATISQQNPTPAEAFAAAVASAVLRDDPPVTLRFGRQSFMLPFMRRWLPLTTLDRILSRKFGLSAL